jgi:hypothetical protein
MTFSREFDMWLAEHDEHIRISALMTTYDQ